MLIENKLRQDWSPEQISGWLKANDKLQISHESIYLYILAGKRNDGYLYKHLRYQDQHRKSYGSYDRGKLPNRVSIDERPGIVNQGERIGDWEVDTIIGKRHRQTFVALTERKSRFALKREVEQRKADLVRDVVIDLLQPVADRAYTITGDNMKEFAEHIRIVLDIDFFFAHPYVAWERGTNENLNS